MALINHLGAKANLYNPIPVPQRTPEEIEEIVELVQLRLHSKGLFCGDRAIRWELEDLGVKPLPSLRTINRILSLRGLTDCRTGRYESKNKPYPELPASLPNQTHQVDLVGPCYLTGPIRFYSLNAIDVAINRCGVQPVFSRSRQSVLDAIWAVWKRMGIPDNVQVDNEMAFYGGPIHPRGMGSLTQLCLLYGITLWFIPVPEPWRNEVNKLPRRKRRGINPNVIEKFNDHYFLCRF